MSAKKNKLEKKQVHRPNTSGPVFLHSLWRSGSTYLFQVFRRSNEGYWCYQEPIHEAALYAKNNPESLLSFSGEKMRHLRHPLLTSSHFLELYETWGHWRELISKPIIYDEYFDHNGSDQLINYLAALIAHAKGRPIIQECRTACRIDAIKKKLGGSHLYLWRNPWDQWWSYKTTAYFDTTSQLILNAPIHPEAITHLQKEINFAEFHHDDIKEEFSHFNKKRPSAENSYKTFYLLWCLGLMEGMTNAELLINIDTLSDSQSYREDISRQLLHFNLTGLDFSDCAIPQTYYRDEDKAFFSELEDRVHGILLLSGYSKEQLTRLQGLRQESEPKLWATPLVDLSSDRLLSNCVRAREILLRQETENAGVLQQNAELLDVELKRSEWLQNEWDTSLASVEKLGRQISLGQKQIVQLSEKLSTKEQELEAQIDSNRVQAHQTQALRQQMQARQEEIRLLEHDRATLEQALSEQTAKSQREIQGLLTQLAQREKEFGERLLRLQEEAERGRAEQARAHAEREQALAAQLQSAREEQRRLAQEGVERQRILGEQLVQAQQDAGQRIEQEKAKQAAREQALAAQLQSVREEQYRLEQEGAARLRVLTQDALQTRQEMEGLLRQVTLREREFGERASELRREAEKERDKQARFHHERQQAMFAQIQITRERAEQERAEQARSLAALEAQLLIERRHLEVTYASLSWRMMAPFRKIASLFAPRRDSGQASISEGQGIPTPLITAAISNPAGPEPQPIGVPQASPAPKELRVPPFATTAGLNVPVAATLDELLAQHDQAFIYCAYQTLLGRDPDEEGLRYYLGRLRTGIPKIHILGQIRRSAEARDYAAKLPRLDAAIRRYRWAQTPILGWLVRPFTRVGRNNAAEMNLRGLESQFFLLGEESNRRLNQLENDLTALHHLVVNQVVQIEAVRSAMSSKSQTNPEPRVARAFEPVPQPKPPSEPEAFKRLSPHAKDIYYQLKIAAANNAERSD